MDKEYIKRKTLLDEIKSLQVIVTGLRTGKGILNEYAKHYKNSVMRIIDEQATADVREVIHGKWKLHDDGSGTCDQCNFRQKNVWDYDNYQNYCGHCGAKMSI